MMSVIIQEGTELHSASKPLDKIRSLMDAAAYGDAVDLLLPLAGADDAPDEPWRLLLLCLLHLGRAERTFSLLGQRHRSHKDAASLLFLALNHLLEKKQYDVIKAFYQSTAEDSAFRGISEYAEGCRLASGFDLEGASFHLRRGLKFAMQTQDMFADDTVFITNYLAYMANQAWLLEPPGFLSSQPPPPQTLVMDDGKRKTCPAPLVILAACNGIYFDKYFPRFAAAVQNMEPAITAHIHVINATGESLGLMAAFSGGDRFRFSDEENKDDHNATYFACSRFLISERIMEFYGKDLLVTDIDTCPASDISPVCNAVADADIAYFQMPGPAPSLLFHAAMLYFRNNERTRRFLALSRDYIVRKFKEHDSWMLDQAALFAAACVSKAWPDDKAARFVDLRERLGDIERYLPVQNIPLDCKMRDRHLFDGSLNVEVDINGKPHIFIA